VNDLEQIARDIAAFWAARDTANMNRDLDRLDPLTKTLAMGMALGVLSRLPSPHRNLFRSFLAEVVNPHMKATGGHEYKVPKRP
jgi:hypothetical protein